MVPAVPTKSVLQPMLVGDIEGRFFVRSYQRGYRWGREEVSRLLNDISDKDGDYYLQPVVVRRDGERWELIDGQQRLTTLFLILSYVKAHLPTASINYSVEYETRAQSASYLEDPSVERRSENIDFFHIFEAKTCISEWFEGRDNTTLAAVEFYQALTKSVYVIWYEPPNEVDPRTLFTRLNVGRIPLTDAELVKAFLLARAERPQEIAAQWDTFERDLRAPEVWSFVTGNTEREATHISLLLDTISGGMKTASRPLFHTFETLRGRIEAESPENVWNEIVDLHSLVQGWYDDRDLFHKIGYLVATGSTFADLVTAGRELTRKAFVGVLDARIRQRIGISRNEISELNYQDNYADCDRLLLLMNVETVRRRSHSSERYSFNAHASREWSLEHISAQSAERLNRAEQWTEWLQRHKQALNGMPHVDPMVRDRLIARIDEALLEITEQKFRNLEEDIVAVFSGTDGSPSEMAHSISNLALLAGVDNSVLNNSCFEVKRREILRLDREGRYIPPATRNVFLKYYTEAEGQQIHFWGPEDREGYLNALVDTVSDFLERADDAQS